MCIHLVIFAHLLVLFFIVLSIVVPVSILKSQFDSLRAAQFAWLIPCDTLYCMWYEFRHSLNLNLTIDFYHLLMYLAFVLSLLLCYCYCIVIVLWWCWNNWRGVSYILSISVLSKRGDKQLEQISASCREAFLFFDKYIFSLTTYLFLSPKHCVCIVWIMNAYCLHVYSHSCPNSLCRLCILMLVIVLQRVSAHPMKPDLCTPFLPAVNHNLHGSAHGETNHNYNYSHSLIMHMAFV